MGCIDPVYEWNWRQNCAVKRCWHLLGNLNAHASQQKKRPFEIRKCSCVALLHLSLEGITTAQVYCMFVCRAIIPSAVCDKCQRANIGHGNPLEWSNAWDYKEEENVFVSDFYITSAVTWTCELHLVSYQSTSILWPVAGLEPATLPSPSQESLTTELLPPPFFFFQIF